MKAFKKLLIAVGLVAVVGGSAFATSGSIMAVSVSFPSNTLSVTNPIHDYEMKYSDIGIGFVSCNYNRGLFKPYASVDLSLTTKLNGLTFDDMKKLEIAHWKVNGMFGPGFEIIDTGVMNLTLTPGIHAAMLVGQNPNDKNMTLTFGVAGEVLFNFFFADGFGLSASCNVAYDFFGISDDRSEKYTNFSIIPRIGFVAKM